MVAEMSFFESLALLPSLGIKLLFALLCGGLIGLERELRSKAAGIKTNMLICVGSALYTWVSVMVASSLADNGFFGDPARVAAQIVSGIGFLGGGAIIQSRGNVHGLTTAATIWVVAAIGLLIGLGYSWMALGATLVVLLVLIGTRLFENYFIDRESSHSCRLTIVDPEGQMRGLVGNLLIRNDLTVDVLELSDSKVSGESLMNLRYRGSQENHNRFILSVSSYAAVKEVKQK